MQSGGGDGGIGGQAPQAGGFPSPGVTTHTGLNGQVSEGLLRNAHDRLPGLVRQALDERGFSGRF